MQLSPGQISTKVKASFATPLAGAAILFASSFFVPEANKADIQKAATTALTSALLSFVSGYSTEEKEFPGNN